MHLQPASLLPLLALFLPAEAGRRGPNLSNQPICYAELKLLRMEQDGQSSETSCVSTEGLITTRMRDCALIEVRKHSDPAPGLDRGYIAVRVINESMATPQQPGPFYCSLDSQGYFSCAMARYEPPPTMAWFGDRLYGIVGETPSALWAPTGTGRLLSSEKNGNFQVRCGKEQGKWEPWMSARYNVR
ncbi:MAG: hypothetical protein M1829_003737 [Trizodia sp. TS-e1964]|nr:MAG: hypothetical protein M1829_003737 [Trizodia sp. TS-e1964]